MLNRNDLQRHVPPGRDRRKNAILLLKGCVSHRFSENSLLVKVARPADQLPECRDRTRQRVLVHFDHNYLLVVRLFGLKCKTPPIPKDQQGFYERELSPPDVIS